MPPTERDHTPVVSLVPYELDPIGSGIDLNEAQTQRAIHARQLYKVADVQLLGGDLDVHNGIMPLAQASVIFAPSEGGSVALPSFT